MLLVPAKRVFLKEEEINRLEKGEVFYVCSGMGGAFKVEYVGKSLGGQLNFESLMDDWPGKWKFEPVDISKKVFRLAPE